MLKSQKEADKHLKARKKQKTKSSSKQTYQNDDKFTIGDDTSEQIDLIKRNSNAHILFTTSLLVFNIILIGVLLYFLFFKFLPSLQEKKNDDTTTAPTNNSTEKPVNENDTTAAARDKTGDKNDEGIDNNIFFGIGAGAFFLVSYLVAVFFGSLLRSLFSFVRYFFLAASLVCGLLYFSLSVLDRPVLLLTMAILFAVIGIVLSLLLRFTIHNTEFLDKLNEREEAFADSFRAYVEQEEETIKKEKDPETKNKRQSELIKTIEKLQELHDKGKVSEAMLSIPKVGLWNRLLSYWWWSDKLRSEAGAKKEDAELMPFHERYVRIKSYSFSTRLLDKFLFRHVDTATVNSFTYRGINVSNISEKLKNASSEYIVRLEKRIDEIEKEGVKEGVKEGELQKELERHKEIVQKQTNPRV